MNKTNPRCLLLKHIWLACSALMLAACDAPNATGNHINSEQWTALTRIIQQQQDRVSAKQLADWIIKDTRDFEIIDLREPGEFDRGHISDARHQRLDQLLSAEGQAALSRHKKQLLVSASGQRAAQVAALLRLNGFDAYSLQGGFQAWLAYTSNPQDDSARDAAAIARQQAVACYFAGDYVAAAGLAVKPQTQSAGYTPPLAPAEPAASVEEVADPLGLGLGLGLDEELEPESTSAPAGLILGEGC